MILYYAHGSYLLDIMKSFKDLLEEGRRLQENQEKLRTEENNEFPIPAVLPIKRMTSCGGGSKGVLLEGSIRALRQTGILSGIDHVTGASVGAISMGLIACGVSEKDFNHLFTKTNLQELMGPYTKVRGPGIIPNFTRTAAPMYQMVRETIHNSIREHLAELEENDPAWQEGKLQEIRDKIAPNSTKKGITFLDLAYLQSKWPERFKNLSVNAVHQQSYVDKDGVIHRGKKQIFNIRTTPNVEIASAIKASAALPLVLEPVPIEINGEITVFIDGGIYDNAPTEDYFDEVTQTFTNTMPEQTLLFAFGQGFENKKNPIFQALYGNSVAQVITQEVIEDIVTNAVKKAAQGKNLNEITVKEIHLSLSHEIEITTRHLATYYSHKEKKDIVDEKLAKAFAQALNQGVRNVFQSKTKLQKIKDAGKGGATELINLLKAEITPSVQLGKKLTHFIEHQVVRHGARFKADYSHAERHEIGFKKIREKYPLRTVELRVGALTATTFNEATKNARVYSTIGYLDTMCHILNHDIPQTPPKAVTEKAFYPTIVNNFLQIQKAVLAGSNGSASNLMKHLLSIQNDNVVENKAREMLYAIKSYVEKHPESSEAFSLARAVEFHSKIIGSQQLFKEVYAEAFKRSSFFSQSKITGTTIFSNRTLQKKLETIDDVSALSGIHNLNTRGGKVYEKLQGLKGFSVIPAENDYVEDSGEDSDLSLSI